MGEPKEYPINTLDDLLAVPDDRLDDCLAEIAVYTRLRRPLVNVLGAVAEEMGAPMQFATGGFVWVDDGQRTITVRTPEPRP